MSGCEYVPIVFGIGAAIALKVEQTTNLVHLGSSDADLQDVITEGKLFVAKFYALKSTCSSNNRQK